MYRVEQNYDGVNESSIPKVPTWIMSVCQFIARVICLHHVMPKMPSNNEVDWNNEDWKDNNKPIEFIELGSPLEAATLEIDFPSIQKHGQSNKKKKLRKLLSTKDYKFSNSKHLLMTCQLQWKFVAHVIERCVLYLYLFFFIASPVFFFFIYPSIFPYENESG